MESLSSTFVQIMFAKSIFISIVEINLVSLNYLKPLSFEMDCDDLVASSHYPKSWCCPNLCYSVATISFLPRVNEQPQSGAVSDLS
jgi:hypothetical protein